MCNDFALFDHNLIPVLWDEGVLDVEGSVRLLHDHFLSHQHRRIYSLKAVGYYQYRRTLNEQDEGPAYTNMEQVAGYEEVIQEIEL